MDITSPTYLAAQAFAFISMTIAISSQQYKNRKAVLLSLSLANGFNALHFLWLEAITGLALAIIGVIRFFIAIYSTKTYWLIIFLLINTIATILVFEGIILSGTSYAAATLIIVSSFLKNDHHMRATLILGTVGWLLYAVMVGSIVSIVACSFFIVSGLIGWHKLLRQ